MKKITYFVGTFLCSVAVNAQTIYSENFETNTLSSWINTDLNNDELLWDIENTLEFVTAALEKKALVSYSYEGGRVTDPDNLITSPVIDLTDITADNLYLLFDQFVDPDYPAEHYAVYITTSNIASEIIATKPVFETTIEKNGLKTNKISLSSFLGKKVYLSFRHFNTTDQYYLVIDNILVKFLYNNDSQLLAIPSLNNAYASNADVKIGGFIKNIGLNPITSIDISWSVNSETKNIDNIKGLNIAPDSTYSFVHIINWNPKNIGEQSFNINIEKVNDAKDPDEKNNSISKKIYIVNEVFQKSVLVEEGTGTWCQYCPYGIVGLKNAYHKYKDSNFIPIAIHNDDPMTLTEYDTSINFEFYPNAKINRRAAPVYPFFEELENSFSTENKIVPIGKVTVTNSSWNPSTREININVSAQFGVDISNSNFNIGAIIVENAVTGTSKDYSQANALSNDNTIDPKDATDWEGKNWINLPNPVPAADMIYDHVGRALLGGFNGVSNIIPASVTYNTPYTTKFTHILPADQDEKEIEIVPVLIDNVTGEIVNAQKVKLNTNTLATDFFDDKLGLKIWPNPSQGILNLSSTSKLDLTVVDLSGKKVYSKNNLFGENVLDLTNLRSGLYFAKVKSGYNESTIKIILK
jgi:hypothetical protein